MTPLSSHHIPPKPKLIRGKHIFYNNVNMNSKQYFDFDKYLNKGNVDVKEKEDNDKNRKAI